MYAQYQQYQNQKHQYQYHQQHQPSVPNHQSQTVVPADPVPTFTRYYHGWTKRVEELTNALNQHQGGSSSDERQTAEHDRNWAKYYAEESSRAAHHFYQNPHATTAPFALPPPPPNEPPTHNHAASTNNYSSNSNDASGHRAAATKSYASAARSSGTGVNHQPASASGGKHPPGSITRYVKRNMERHRVQNDPGLKKYVQTEIESVIAAAIQKKTLQSQNWDLVPLVALPGEEKSTSTGEGTPDPVAARGDSPRQHQPHHRQHNGPQSHSGRHCYDHDSSYASSPARKNKYSTNNSYYGSNATAGSSSENNNNSYYGPASSHTDNNHNNNHTTVRSTNNFRKLHSPGNKNNNNSFSNSSVIGKKSKKKNGKRNQEEDFMSFGHYGPDAGSRSSPSGTSSSHKKSKKHHPKTHRTKPAIPGTMHNDGMDYSDQAMTKRANRFSGRGGIREAASANLRMGIGGSGSGHDRYMGRGTIGGTNVALSETDFEQMTVKGTCRTLEKQYLRLTAPPRAELVRPLEILQQHLRNLQSEYFCCGKGDEHSNPVLHERMQTPEEQWKTIGGDGEEHNSSSDGSGSSRPQRRHDYLWFCSQLKSIRQDCTVQRIQGDLAVDVYETHARIALQEGDLNEYNQCQTQLKELYKTLPSADSRNKSVLVRGDGICSNWKHREEFVAYRLLYYVFLSTNEVYSGGSSDIYHIMLSLTATEQNHPAIRHALKVREAVALSDYFWFFRLHKTSPNLGIFLTEHLVPTMRLRALRRIAKAYRPSIDLKVCFEQLGFYNRKSATDGKEEEIDWDSKSDGIENDGVEIDEEAKSWLISCGGVIDGSKFVTKDSEIHAPVTEDKKKNSLI